ncbi:MAG TPA: lanthionine synthetase C family protein [Thermoanaerobaculia bacterium]|nr:lanthionine synthetase C family protein [Thermoanaerobaculia bacterium]
MPTPPDPAWSPLLAGDAASAAAAAVDAIAAGLQVFAEEPPGGPSGGSGRDLSLAGGQAGIALFFSYLHFARPGEGHDDTAMTFLERAIEGTSELPVGSGLYGGFPGVAWTLEHLAGRLFDPEGEDPGEEIATVLAEFLARSPWQGDYDLISGLVGFAVYALERLPRPGGRECLEGAIARLAETAQAMGAGPKPEELLSWHTPSERVGALQAATYPEGHYNLGVAHGVPAVIGVLGEALAAGVAEPEARRLLDGAAGWVLAQRLPAGADSLFPYNTAPGIAPNPTRLAWCYGDLGIAASLLAAARTAGDPRLEAEALAIARHAAERAIAGSGVQDCGLCHGAAGVAHLFNRLYQATGEPALGAAARTWYDQALARRGTAGIGGYQAWLPSSADRMGDLAWMDDPGFLTGSAGIGLALLAATSAVEPGWDRVLLTAIQGSAPMHRK